VLKDTTYKRLSLCNTKHNLDTLWFLLQVCRTLLEAAKSGDVNTVKGLVRCSNDNCTTDDNDRNTPLMYAVANGHLEVVRALLEGGYDVERTSARKWTPLHEAAWYGHLEICRLLLDWGAKVNPVNGRKDTPLDWATWNGRSSVVKLLEERGRMTTVRPRVVGAG